MTFRSFYVLIRLPFDFATGEADGHRLPPGVDDDDRTAPWLRMSAAAETERDDDKQTYAEDDAEKRRRPEMPWHPVDENGKPIPPHPDDPRFDKDGNPKPEWFGNSSTKRWAGRNSRWNPDLDDGKDGKGGFEYYEDRPNLYYRDPKNPEQWVKKNPETKIKEELETGPKLKSPPPPPPGDADMRTKKGRKSIGKWLAEIGIWYEGQSRDEDADHDMSGDPSDIDIGRPGPHGPHQGPPPPTTPGRKKRGRVR